MKRILAGLSALSFLCFIGWVLSWIIAFGIRFFAEGGFGEFWSSLLGAGIFASIALVPVSIVLWLTSFLGNNSWYADVQRIFVLFIAIIGNLYFASIMGKVYNEPLSRLARLRGDIVEIEAHYPNTIEHFREQARTYYHLATLEMIGSKARKDMMAEGDQNLRMAIQLEKEYKKKKADAQFELDEYEQPQ